MANPLDNAPRCGINGPFFGGIRLPVFKVMMAMRAGADQMMAVLDRTALPTAGYAMAAATLIIATKTAGTKKTAKKTAWG